MAGKGAPRPVPTVVEVGPEQMRTLSSIARLPSCPPLAVVAGLVLYLASAWNRSESIAVSYVLIGARGDVLAEGHTIVGFDDSTPWPEQCALATASLSAAAPAPAMWSEPGAHFSLVIHDGTAYLPSKILVSLTGRLIRCELRGDGDLEGGAAQESFADGLRALLDDALRRPAVKLRALARTSPTHRTSLQRLGDGGPPTEPSFEPAITRIVSVARQRPDHPALRYQGESWTYSELITAAAATAGALRAVSTRTDHPVLLALPRSALAVVGILGTALAGMSYIPIDCDAPPDRLWKIIRSAAPAVALCDGSNLADALGSETDFPALDITATVSPADIGLPALRADSLAYTLFTSGTTGEPKGVQIDQRALAHMCAEIGAAYRIGPEDRVLGFAPLFFDVSVFEVFATLTAGATLCIADDDQRIDPDLLSAMMRQEQVTVAELPPALLPLLDPDALPDLRLLSVGGEAFAGKLVEVWRTARREFWNGYGPTETTVVVTLKRCDGAYVGNPPIGRPMPGYRAHVVDEELRLVPRGSVGELCISGPCVAVGYSGSADETASAFVPTPDGTERMYRTGDLVRWRADGDLDFLGRVDRQVKVAGNRIELLEIEAVMLSYDGVVAASAQVIDTPVAPMLIGYFVGSEVDKAELHRHLRGALPSYAMPQRLIGIPAIPLTVSGKVDLTALASAI